MKTCKLLKRATTCVLSALLAFSVAACTQKTEDENIVYYTPSEDFLATKGLHKVVVTDTNKTFAVNGKTDYKVVVPTLPSESLITAADFFVKYIGQATNAVLPIVSAEQVNWSTSEKLIVIGCKDMFTAAGLTMPSEKLGVSGYYIKTVGNSVFVAVEQNRGYQHAMLSLLEHIVGYEKYASDLILFEKDGSTIPDFDIVEKPDFAYYITGNCVTGREDRYAWGEAIGVYNGVYGGAGHNSFHWLSPEKWADEHPSWFADDRQQLCYTAHGNEAEYELMQEACLNVLKEHLDDSSDYTVWNFSMQDNTSTCTCEACAPNLGKYNTAAASTIMFLNDLSEKTQAWLEEKAEAEGREKVQEVEFMFYAYYQWLGAPVKLVDGKYEPIDENVRCSDHVGVMYAPIEAVFNQSIHHDSNISYAETLKGWGACTKNIYFWLYQTNFSNYLYPMNTWESLVEWYRFGFENNAKMFTAQGQWDMEGNTAFAEFKEYIDAKMAYNVNYSFGELKEKYFNGYFADAAEPMMQYFNELLAHLRYIEGGSPEVSFGHIHAKIAQTKFWPKGLLDHWLALIDQAYARIEKYKNTDNELYTILHNHINKESIFLRYAMISHQSGYYLKSDLQKMKKDFESDCALLGFTHHHESVPISGEFATW